MASKQVKQALRRAAILIHHLKRPRSGGGAGRVVPESRDYRIGELRRCLHAGKALRRGEGGDDLLEVEGVGAHRQGLAAEGGLDGIVAAGGNEAAAEESDMRQAVQRLKLAHDVADDDLCGFA